MPTEQMSLRIPREVKEELERLAKEDGRSLSNYVVRILTDHVNAVSRRRSKK